MKGIQGKAGCPLPISDGANDMDGASWLFSVDLVVDGSEVVHMCLECGSS